ncbi:MAG: ATP-dependent sacrificial sulfur transferase LarE [Acidobacteriota bacterium]
MPVVADVTPMAARKEEELLSLLRGLPRAMVAFSGGVDSSYLVSAARVAMGDRVLAVTALSPSVPEVQREMARRIAAEVGVAHRFVDTAEMGNPGYRENSLQRCYHCKTELYGTLEELGAREGFDVILSGTNKDDLGDFRPGLRAASERAVRHPLCEVGLDKAEIRVLSRRAGLPTWDAPASPCLASRVPYGQEVTVDKLSQIEKAEAVLRRFGFHETRVRHHGDVARIEVAPDEIARIVASADRAQIVREIKGLGFRHVALDLEGYRTGSLHQGLEK